jgi:hypothetical protein
LIAGVKITAYNLHGSAPFSRALVALHAQLYRVQGADAVMKSNLFAHFANSVRDLLCPPACPDPRGNRSCIFPSGVSLPAFWQATCSFLINDLTTR